VHKRRRRWADVADCSERAAVLSQGRNEAAWWNAGIAATALHDWPRARAAWREFGFDLDADGGPVQLPMGAVALAAGTAPPVHAHRVDPARARVLDVPLPDTGLAFDDLVLCDAEPLGEVPGPGDEGAVRVVAVLERWRASGIPTVRASVECASPADRDALLAAAGSAGLAVTDWSSRTGDDGAGWRLARLIGLAGDPVVVHAVLDGWRAARPAGRAVHDADTQSVLPRS